MSEQTNIDSSHTYHGSYFNLEGDSENGYEITSFSLSEDIEIKPSADLDLILKIIAALDDAADRIASDQYDDGYSEGQFDCEDEDCDCDGEYEYGYEQGQADCEEELL